MSIKTASGLVAYATAQVGKPYWYATFGNTASASLLTAKRKQYPEYYDPAKYRTGWTGQYGLRVHDCVGLIKGYLWSDSPTAKPVYKKSQDVSANGMRDVCTEKGKIETIPEVPGVLVFMNKHVGVYIGGGYVIEAKGHDYGVVKTALKSRPWTSWGKCPWIEYPSTVKKPAPVVKPEASANVKYFKKYTGNSVSIADALDAIGEPCNYSYRKKVAKANGISGYIGLPQQNKMLLQALRAGELIKP